MIGSFRACACKLSWTLLFDRPGAGRKESSGTGLCCPLIVGACRPSEIVGNLKDNHSLPDDRHDHPMKEGKTTAQEHSDTTLPQNNRSPIPQFASRISGDLSGEGNAEAFPTRFPIMQAERYDSGKAEMVTSSANNSRRSPKPSESSESSTSGIDNSISDGNRCEKALLLEKKPTQSDFFDKSAALADTDRQLLASRGARGNSIDTRNTNGSDAVVEGPSEHFVEIPETAESVAEIIYESVSLPKVPRMRYA